MKYYILLLSAFLFLGNASAQNLKYSIIGIADSLTKNANSVLRLYEETFVVENAGKAIHKVHFICTVLNKVGDSEGVLSIHHDKLTKINNLDGNLYNATGELVTKLKKTHIRDFVNEADYEFTDDKQRIAKFDYGKYPYTVEFEYELSNTNMMFYPIFQPQGSFNMSVQDAKLTVTFPPDLKPRYKEVNMKNKVAIGTNGTQTTYTWKIKNLPAHKLEPFATPWYEKCPTVYIAPAEFEVSGYKGSFNTWEDFGKFQTLLNKERDVLPANTIAKIEKLVADAPTRYEKTKRIYEYMQSKTRYVSIQLGIGGWQTLPAELVDNKGYGDCKALSNYMKSMLKTVGIESHYTIISAGKNVHAVQRDFPCAMFNHIILCVPMERDTVWLECTSQNQPFGFLGSFTDNRDCLLITPSGGKIVKTPQYLQQINTQTRQVTVKMLPSGEASVKATTTYKGLQTENDHIDHYVHESKDNQKKWLVEQHLNMPQFDIVSLDLKETKTQIPTITENLEVKLKSFGVKNGKRIFIVPNLMNKTNITLAENETRMQDIYLDFPDHTDIDTLRYELPEGYHVEGTPIETNIKSVFGEYKTTIKVEQTNITYIRTCSMRGGRYSREEYKALLEFYKNITKADNTKLVLVKAT